MEKKQTLDKLEELLKDPGLTKGFRSQEACLEWASKVAPLLKFDSTYHGTFLAHFERLTLRLSADLLGASLRIMIAQARMAANELRSGNTTSGPMPEEAPRPAIPRAPTYTLIASGS